MTSTCRPGCQNVFASPELIRSQTERWGPRHRFHGDVLKPIDLQSGHATKLDPDMSDLHPGWILQRQIYSAACHRTLFGSHTAEVRTMGLPDENGRLIAGLIFTRVKAPQVFLSNADHTARLNIPGTGEGYGIIVYD